MGVSIGSLAGALYAFEPDIHAVQQRIGEYLRSPGFQEFQQRMMASQTSTNSDDDVDEPSMLSRLKNFVRANYLCQRAVLRPSILSGDVLHHAVDHLLPDADIAEAMTSLSIVAVDLLAGERVILERGSVRASSSIPGVFPPVAMDGKLLCDIGVLNSLPTPATRTYNSGCLVAVDVSSAVKPLTRCDTAVDVLVRMNDVGEMLFREQVSAIADVVICPDVCGVAWFDFSNPDHLLELGRQAGRHALVEVERACCNS